jgi:hypothetical protein
MVTDIRKTLNHFMHADSMFAVLGYLLQIALCSYGFYRLWFGTKTADLFFSIAYPLLAGVKLMLALLLASSALRHANYFFRINLLQLLCVVHGLSVIRDVIMILAHAGAFWTDWFVLLSLELALMGIFVHRLLFLRWFFSLIKKESESEPKGAAKNEQ